MNRCVGPLSDVLEPGFGRRRRLEFVSALRYVYDMLKGEGASSAGYIQERGMLGTASAKAIRHNYCLRVSFSMARIRDYMLRGEWPGLLAAVLPLVPRTVDQECARLDVRPLNDG